MLGCHYFYFKFEFPIARYNNYWIHSSCRDKTSVSDNVECQQSKRNIPYFDSIVNLTVNE